MLSQPTVFVLGAGAGTDIDMPTGEKLITQIAERLNIRFDHESGRPRKVSGDDRIIEALSTAARSKDKDINALFAAGRQISAGVQNTKSIDDYVRIHRDKEDIKICAKIAIVRIILECENGSKIFADHRGLFRDQRGALNSWLRAFVQLLNEGVTAADNLGDIFRNLTIINFNYDRCIEHYLFAVLQRTFLIDGAAAAKLLSTLDIYHPYGTLGPLPWQAFGRPGPSTYAVAFGEDVTRVDLARLSENIRTYNEEVKEGEELKKIREALDRSDRVVFLGFHFHRQNVELIAPEKFASKGKHHSVYGTVLGRSGPDRDLIRTKDIPKMLSVPSPVNLHPGDCGELFRVYGNTFAQ